MAEIIITIAAVCAILITVFVMVTFLEDRRRKRRQKSKGKALAGRRDWGAEEEGGEYGDSEEFEAYGDQELWGDRELYGDEELYGEALYGEEELQGEIEPYEEEDLYEADGVTSQRNLNEEENDVSWNILKEEEDGADWEVGNKRQSKDEKMSRKKQTEKKRQDKRKVQTEEPSQAEGKKQVEEESPAEENLRNEGKAQTEEKSQDIEENPPEEQQTQQENLPVPIIGVRNVTMKFRIATGSTSGLKDYLIQKIKKQISTRELMALDHVSFDVFKGEVVGIIGTNGSGKSTLLKIVSGALNPSEGSVSVDKKKVQMLSLGAGFDVELSARENVYLNGAIIGYTKEFINRNYDKIVEFSELEGFMDEKVKNFSSGMVSRLAFAIATVGEAAEILILDEVLSVGDEFFKKKSLARVKDMIHGGSTVLMVSHGMSTILDNCTKVVWIEKGKLQMVGEPKAVCAAYRNQFG